MSDTFSQHFNFLDAFLLQYRHLWQISPFHASRCEQLPWHQENTELCQWLMSLDLAKIDDLHQNQDKLVEQLTHFIPQLAQVSTHINLQVRLVSNTQLFGSIKPLSQGISGRKWQQICAMSEFAIESFTPDQWLEWCAGKGYLGQVLSAKTNKKVISLERDQLLCEKGRALANKHQLEMEFIEQDVLADDAFACLSIDKSKENTSTHAVALHACGDLHHQLIAQAPKHKLAALTVSPCCYHLTRHETYQALSQQGKESLLTLTNSDLRMVVQETVTGGKRVKSHRQLEMTYRLALDSLLRTHVKPEYIAIPSIKKSLLSNGFEEFCHWAIAQKNLDASTNLYVPAKDLQHWLKNSDIWLDIGKRRFLAMERLNLLQQIFKRPLEMWLAYDKALYLISKTYQVQLCQLTAKAVTPRNIIIQAKCLSL